MHANQLAPIISSHSVGGPSGKGWTYGGAVLIIDACSGHRKAYTEGKACLCLHVLSRPLSQMHHEKKTIVKINSNVF